MHDQFTFLLFSFWPERGFFLFHLTNFKEVCTLWFMNEHFLKLICSSFLLSLKIKEQLFSLSTPHTLDFIIVGEELLKVRRRDLWKYK